MKMQNYITLKENNKNKFKIKNVLVSINDKNIQSEILKKYILSAFNKVPINFLSGLKSINIGQYKHLKDRDLSALYDKGNIFLSSSISSYDDVVDDIIHEIAHHIEILYDDYLYKDGLIEKEFLEKRKKLWSKLKSKGIELDLQNFLNTKFDIDFDEFLYRTVGYPTLRLVTANLFYSPYGSTSLREYFANGFEAFFMKEEISILNKVSPILYDKITGLLKMEEV